MTKDFLSQLNSKTMRSLIGQSELMNSPMVLVSSALLVESCNKQAEKLWQIRPMESVETILSEQTIEVLRKFFQKPSPCFALEELNGAEYRLEILPQRDSALLTFMLDTHADYDGSLRIIHYRSAQTLSVLMSKIKRMRSKTLSKDMWKQCLKLQRTVEHMEWLHEPPNAENLEYLHENLAELCRETAAQVQKRTDRVLTLNLPKMCLMPLNARFVRSALYNLLINAVNASPRGETIDISLRKDDAYATVTIADRGQGMDARRFQRLLEGWRKPCSFKEYASGQFGFGLPYTQMVAQLHRGQLLFSPREGGGSEFHLTLAILPDSLVEKQLRTHPIFEHEYTMDELELSAL